MWVQPERQRVHGSAPKPRWMLRPGLLYAQVIKTVHRRRLVRMSHGVMFGTLAAVSVVLAKRGWQINISFVERWYVVFRVLIMLLRKISPTIVRLERKSL
jgi:hypothetical protein